MNSDQLQQFKIIAECESITKAAEALYLSQPAVSKTLKILETELDCELFYRDSNKLKITPEGKRLLEYAEIVISTINTAKREFESFDRQGRIKLYGTGHYLPQLLQDYMGKNGGTLEIHVEPDDIAADMLLKKRADILIADDYYLRHYNTKHLEKWLLFTEQLTLVVTENHDWSYRTWIPITEIQGEPLLDVEMETGVGSWLREAAKLNHCNFNINMRLDPVLFSQMREDLTLPHFSSSTEYSSPYSAAYLKNRTMIRVNGLYTSRNVYAWFQRDKFRYFDNVVETIKFNAEKVVPQISRMLP